MTTPDTTADRYRRRNRWPVLVLVVLLLTGAGVVWFQILRPAPALATGCNEPGPAPSSSTTSRSRTSSSGTGTSGAGTATTTPGTGTAATTATGSPEGGTSPATGTTASAPVTALTTARTGTATTGPTSGPTATTTLGAYVDRTTLAATRPANPQNIALQVFNGSTTRGLAGTVTNDLRSAGFESIKDARDDVLYPARDLSCYGQIRFGAAGLSQARTILLIAPCAQLVMDDRIDASVDLSLGAQYRFDGLTPQVRAQLQEIITASAPPPVIEGQTAAARPQGSIPPLPEVDCSAGSPPESSVAPSTSSSVPSTTSVAPTTSGDEPTGSTSSEPATTTSDDESGDAPEVATNDGDDIFGG